ncbi:uncharacterized protein C1orf194 homolog [Xenia sp. Carnegie-2017]|uniref:uncharacterized protein C1orf194 homolog n=1 Tax=Xenia sp. Carnegie-2017 TaxID=2897299 RepID=UPI001F04E22B|nr:uncharacterized protein C1orf194 homolog [Xenia sp. Carnegie-2017]
MPRNPYPFPQVESDDNFVKGDRRKYGEPYQTVAERSNGDDQWNRLYRAETLSSKRREVLYFDPQAPSDSLDFVIKSTYDHHGEFLSSKAETLIQPETRNFQNGRVLKNRPPPAGPMIDLNKLPLRISSSNKRESVHSVNGAIESHHSAATNRGYSRKHDGGFYAC